MRCELDQLTGCIAFYGRAKQKRGTSSPFLWQIFLMLGTRLIYFPQCPCVKSRMRDAADWLPAVV